MKRVLSLLCALLLTATAVCPVIGAAADPVPAKDVVKMTLYDQILLRDGFIEGVWYPWFTHDNLGNGFTTNFTAKKYITNPWYDFGKVGIDSYGADKIYAEIYNLKALGYNMLAIAASAYGEGVLYDDNGDVIGIKQEYLTNARRFLDICREIGMPVMWNICFHSSSMPDYYGMDAWNIICRMYADRRVADHYAERFVRPVCQMLADYPDVVGLVCLGDELENEIHDDELGRAYGGKWYGTTKENMVYFMTAMNEVAMEELPDVARTVAANNDDLSCYAHLDLDVLGRNRYANDANPPSVPSLYPTAPLLLTEYNLGSLDGMNEQQLSDRQVLFRKNMKRDGYQGGFLWCWQPNNFNGGIHDMLRPGTNSNTDFRQSMYDTYYYTVDSLREYRGETVALEAPVLFFNEGDGWVRWILSRQATAIEILRSTDGGKSWTVAATGKQSDYVSKDKGVFKDSVRGAMYKIVAYDQQGNVAVSAPSNVPGVEDKYVREKKTISVERFYRPAVKPAAVDFASTDELTLKSIGGYGNRCTPTNMNTISYGSFELASLSAPWNVDTFLGDTVKVVSDSTAPLGVKSLLFDTTGIDTPVWRYFTVKVEPHKDYVLSAWIKGAYVSDDNRFYASLGVLNPATGKFAIYKPREGNASRPDSQIYPTAWDEEWHLRSVEFNSGNHSEVVIALYGCNSKMWVDDIALYESCYGFLYKSEQSVSLPRLSIVYENTYCDPDDSAIANPCLEDAADRFWQEGYGWDMGFMSVDAGIDGYGNALRYDATDGADGYIYLRWFDVKPQTNYVFSMDYKVLEEGSATFCLVADRLNNPVDFMTVDLDDSGEPRENGWCRYTVKYNTDCFDRIGVMITDKGGAALFDNIRFFELKKGVSGQDLYLNGVETIDAVGSGDTASVTVDAIGDGLKYQWYFKDKTHSKFYLTTSFTGKTYSTKMDATRDGRQVYCVVTDKYGTSRKTAVTTLTMKPTALKITAQPKTSTYVKDGATAKVTVKAQGDGLKYAWYFKNAGKTSYSKSSITTATYSVKMSSSASDRRLYCVITDAYGNSVKTNTVVIRRQVAIIKQPATVTYAKNGAKASVKITAGGDGLKYAWYVKNASASKYSKSSVTSSTYSVTMSDSVKGRRVYCVVTDKYGKKVQSETFLLRMAATITTQPKTVTVKKNATAKVTVKAKGDGLKYTWYIKNEGAKKYSKSSVTKSTYSATMNSKSKNRLVYCVVTDKYGNKVQSKTVRLKMK